MPRPRTCDLEHSSFTQPSLRCILRIIPFRVTLSPDPLREAGRAVMICADRRDHSSRQSCIFSSHLHFRMCILSQGCTPELLMTIKDGFPVWSRFRMYIIMHLESPCYVVVFFFLNSSRSIQPQTLIFASL